MHGREWHAENLHVGEYYHVEVNAGDVLVSGEGRFASVKPVNGCLHAKFNAFKTDGSNKRVSLSTPLATIENVVPV